MAAEGLKRFEFTDEIIDRFRAAKKIPLHFYNSDGQILIYPTDDVSEKEIDALLKFLDQGIFFREEDAALLGIKPEKRKIPEGLSDTIVLSEHMVRNLAHDTEEFFKYLKEASMNALSMKKMQNRIEELFKAFELHPEAMIGLIDILHLMQGVPDHDVEIAVKRTVVSMAMKTRGMQAQSYKDSERLYHLSTILMMSALLCDVGFVKMHLPEDKTYNALEQLAYIEQHPLISYLMLAHLKVDPRIKHNILVQHRPLRQGETGNNYPDLEWLIDHLMGYIKQHKHDPERKGVVLDMEQQIQLLKREIPYDEDANILALASEFASLTTELPGRNAIPPEMAVKMIINNSYFTYTDRIIREFLDYVAISLCDNQMILKAGDFVAVAVRPADHRTYFEICRINYVDRYQSQPALQRIASAGPKIEKFPRLKIKGFEIQKQARIAHYDLGRDSSRSICYVIDPELNPELYDQSLKIAGPWP